MERTNKTNTSKHDQNSPPQLQNLEKEKDPHYSHLFTTAKKTHHTSTEVVAKIEKQNKSP
jgi:hypothetical protein